MPSQATRANFGASLAIGQIENYLAAKAGATVTILGIPVSTTHTITGAIVGVGASRRLSAVRWGVAGNILGGLAVGMLQRHLDISAALQTYTLLTVGEGIVTQIPALLISAA